MKNVFENLILFIILSVCMYFNFKFAFKPKKETELHILYVTPYSVILKDNDNNSYIITDSSSLDMIYFH